MQTKKYWEIKNKVENEKNIGEICLYGDISDSKFWDDDVTPKDIDNELKAIGSMDELNIYVNSGGGSVFAGMAIYNILKRSDAKVKNAYIDGLAASISSVIPLAADNVFIPENAMMMIHNPSTIAFGDSSDMRKTADTLDKIKESIVAVYASKTGKDEKEINNMMDKETWMTAKDAISLGFASEIQEGKNINASLGKDHLNINGQIFNINNYTNIPKSFLNYIQSNEKNDKIKKEIFTEIETNVNNIIEEQNKSFNNLRLKIMGGI